MEVNNKNEINKMYGVDEESVTQSTPDLQTSPNGELSSPPPADFEFDAPTVGGGRKGEITDEDGIVIGDHESFGFTGAGGKGASVIFLPVLFILGLAIGLFGCYFHFFGINVSAEKSAAKTAMLEIYDYVKSTGEKPEKAVFADIYIRDNTEEYECVVFSVIEYSMADYKDEIFFVTIDKYDDSVVVYEEFDQKRYDTLSSSKNDIDKVKAQYMLNHQEVLQRMLNAIREEDSDWVRVDPTYLLVDFAKSDMNDKSDKAAEKKAEKAEKDKKAADKKAEKDKKKSEK